MTSDVAGLATRLLAGDRRALARAITLVESQRIDHQSTAEGLIEAVLAKSGSSIRLGISGPPGVGKSTFIEVFGLYAIEHGRRVAVLAVDPTSKISGGSILGDKTRMSDLAKRREAFIRPSPAGNTLGGVARRTREAILLCEAAGFDLVIVETVGVGQSETAVAEMTDMFLLLLAPAGGDDLQGVKRGVMELADLIIVNKADGDLLAQAKRTQADYANAMRLMAPAHKGWLPEALVVSSIRAEGLEDIWRQVIDFRDLMTKSGEWHRQRRRQVNDWLHHELSENLLAALRSDPEVAQDLARAEKRVAAGKASPVSAARTVLARFLGRAR